MNIVLLGYMGCGKSSIGRRLASDAKKSYLDLDDYIEIQEKKSIKLIFEEKGEIYFRKKETEYLKKVLKESTDTVISLGGGVPCFSGNMDFIKEDAMSKSVYLKTSLDELVRRLFTEREKRPLIAHARTEEDLKDFIRKHLFERSFYYNQAEYVIATDNKEVGEIAAEVLKTLF